MPRHSAEFGSALPGVAEIKSLEEKESKSEAVKRREQPPLEKAQFMWDVYQDIKTAWVDFVRSKRSGKRKEDIDSVFAGAEQGNEVSSEHVELLRLVLPRLRDDDNPLSQEFRATPKFQKLHSRLAELWSDKPTQEAWRGEMQKEAGQWAEVNGSWEKYLGKKTEERGLENEYDALMKEKFDERGKPPARRRRTLLNDIADVEMALVDVRGKIKELRGKNPELAAKILADELRERRRELNAPEHFMIFPSRQEIIEEGERIASARRTQRALALVGESGTGKTSIAKILARKLTGHELLDAKATTMQSTTKVGRALFADKDLESPEGKLTSSSIYGPVLRALTGKRRANAEPEHDGRAVALDEFNRLSQDEGGKALTELDSIEVDGVTGYSDQGADPRDRVQPNALIITMENPATARYKNRTKFSPENERKRDKIPVPPLRQTENEPELYESFLVVLQDAEGRLRAKKEEVAPAWEPTEDALKKTKQDRLNTESEKGGALWRLSQMLHESYENLAHRPNTLTNTNPDEWLAGRVLTYGDVYQWLEEYKKEVTKGVSLDHFISGKIIKWLETSFQDSEDAGDKLLYYKLAKEFALVAKETNPDGSEKTDGAFIALPAKKITPNFLTEKAVAELSPRVPRKITGEGAKELPKPPEFESMTFDCSDYETNAKYKKVAARVDKTTTLEQYIRPGTTPPSVYRLVGTIKECAKYPAIVGKFLLENESKPEQKLVAADLTIGLVKKESEGGASVIVVRNALNPYRESLLESGIPNIDRNPLAAERKEVTWNLADTLRENAQTYRDMNLPAWADNIATADLKRLTPEKRKIIEAEIAAGAVPVCMPDKATQLNTSVDQFKKAFKPVWIKENKQQNVKDAYLEWDHFIKLITDKAPELVEGVPNRPYISMMKPSQKPDTRTTNKTVADQLVEFATIKTERVQARQAPANVTNPHEYGALQTVSSRRAKALMPGSPTTLNPIDSATFSRFINLPISPDRLVPSGYFSPDYSRAVFDGNGAGHPHAKRGFRLSVRVEL